MIKVVVTSPEFREMKGIGKTSGKPYHMRIQTAHAYTVAQDGTVAEFPDKFEIALDEGQFPFAREGFRARPAKSGVKEIFLTKSTLCNLPGRRF